MPLIECALQLVHHIATPEVCVMMGRLCVASEQGCVFWGGGSAASPLHKVRGATTPHVGSCKRSAEPLTVQWMPSQRHIATLHVRLTSNRLCMHNIWWGGGSSEVGGWVGGRCTPAGSDCARVEQQQQLVQSAHTTALKGGAQPVLVTGNKALKSQQ
jgi:hypothetical protein